jgi:hypothetical protein
MPEHEQVRVTRALLQARTALRLCRQAALEYDDPFLRETTTQAIEAIGVNLDRRHRYHRP